MLRLHIIARGQRAQRKLQTDGQLSVETKNLLTDIGIGHWLPEGWAIEGDEYEKETSHGKLGAYRIQLVSRYSDETITVRHRYLDPPTDFLASSANSTDETATPLEAAITDFNAMHNKVDGLCQPPINPDPKFDSLSPRYAYLTVKDVQKVFLTYVVNDLNGGELRTGELAIDIAETLTEPHF